MARKSRKGLEATTDHETGSKDIDLNAGAHLRISQGRPDDTSESIDNQLRIIADFVRYRPDITIKSTYRDIGVSGRAFERAGFQKMLADIEAGKINCVIVKDLSRFVRNYIEVGYYIKLKSIFGDVTYQGMENTQYFYLITIIYLYLSFMSIA